MDLVGGSPMFQEVKVGSVLDGRFEISSVIGHGAYSSVFDATEVGTGRRVAIKAPMPGINRNPIYLSRFEREEKIGTGLHHPSILRMIPVDKKSRPYIVMERLEGVTLSHLLKEGVPMPVPEALRIAALIARTLEYLHEQKVVHRDLKPANIMLCSDQTLRVIDFGLAKWGEAPDPGPAISQAFGTPDYMPPEQVCGKSGDRRSDLYALGAMLYEMVTGYPPFRGSDPFTVMHARVLGDPVAPSSLNPALAPEVEEMILHALERDPARRYPSAADFRRELENPAAVPLTGRVSHLQAPPGWRIQWRRVREFVFALAAALAFIGIMVIMAWKWGRQR